MARGLSTEFLAGNSGVAFAMCFVPEWLALLVGKGADPNSVDDEGSSLLHNAVQASGFARAWGEESVKVLLEAGASVNARNKEGRTPLDVVPYNGSPMIKLLRAHGGKTGAEAAQAQ